MAQSADPHPRTLVPREIYASLDAYVIGQEKSQKNPGGGRIQPLQAHPRRRRTPPKLRSRSQTSCWSAPPAPAKLCSRKPWPAPSTCPFAICDATSLTESGYVGEDVENILLRLIQAADWDIPACRTGHHLYRRAGQDRSQRGRQPVYHPGRGRRRRAARTPQDNRRLHRQRTAQGGRKHPHQEMLQINTRNILFICGGAFDGLEDMINKRLSIGSSMGFLATGHDRAERKPAESATLEQVTPKTCSSSDSSRSWWAVCPSFPRSSPWTAKRWFACSSNPRTPSSSSTSGSSPSMRLRWNSPTTPWPPPPTAPSLTKPGPACCAISLKTL